MDGFVPESSHCVLLYLDYLLDFSIAFYVDIFKDYLSSEDQTNNSYFSFFYVYILHKKNTFEVFLMQKSTAEFIYVTVSCRKRYHDILCMKIVI